MGAVFKKIRQILLSEKQKFQFIEYKDKTLLHHHEQYRNSIFRKNIIIKKNKFQIVSHSFPLTIRYGTVIKTQKIYYRLDIQSKKKLGS